MIPKPSPDSRSTLLIVDDQEENLRVVGTVLTALGYDIIAANSANQAFKRLASKTPDLVLLDMIMPDMDGLEMCRRLKEEPRWRDIPVIFLSAADDKNLVVQALEAGGVDYVTKPFNKAELVSRVRTQLALKEARDQLRNLAEDKDEILGVLAHDLKNHLAGISLSAELVLNCVQEISPEYGNLVRNITQSSNHMASFITGFLANQAAERSEITLQPINLVELASAIASVHQVAAQLKQIEIITAFPEAPALIYVNADAEGLRQVLDNLISNAIKFTPMGGRVAMRIHVNPTGLAEWRISDSGPGFTEGDREKMFRRYGRLSARPSAGELTTGLGLSIVKRLVEAMHGRIFLADDVTPGTDDTNLGGATFVVSLPICSKDEAMI
jgi:two-component system sensor histidine kinase/response regulator